MAKYVLSTTDTAFSRDYEGSIALSPNQQEQYKLIFERIGIQVNELVAANWSAIERTADELLRRRILSGNEVDAIISAAKSF